MNAETRAKELFPLAFGETLSPEQAAFRDRIADAITRAENDKLEEAARAIRLAYVTTATPPVSNAVVSEDYLEGLNDALADVLALKSKD